ncbi:hypothetical protein BDV27DRAFT_157795 [Aspergillus caelatus]|uniref:Polyketide synthase n=1 Tax=Aspergillus caelatus TaxID=61420 RepID=A0A5N7A5V3_9EURO|nr:uncharacterized protein BDV27DRAFT_157795 [Aspergillus caelatus]KAE8364489.1 hypothetical protein BDV27DRAFT_157795 [Aspergillus caelatus]
MQSTSFLFGTLTPSHNSNSIRDLKCYFDQTPGAEWMLATVAELPDYWDLLVKKLPFINGSLSGRQVLDDFHRWLRHGFNADENSPQLGNILLLPTVVIIGLIEYWHFVEAKNPGCDDPLQEFISQLHEGDMPDSEAIGLCAGQLTAYAVASSRTRSEFERYGSVAIRLAMMIGAATDALDARHGKAKSYVAAWRNPEQCEQMKRAIGLVYPQAYISVWLDERRVTITTTAQWIRSSLLRQFQGAGLTVAESTIQGPIHSPSGENKDIAKAICEMCQATPTLHLGDTSNLALRTYTNDGHGIPVDKGSLHEQAVQSTLVTECNWHGTFASLPLSHKNSTQGVVAFGPDRCVPQSFTTSVGARFLHVSRLGHYNVLSNSINRSTSSAVTTPTAATPAAVTPAPTTPSSPSLLPPTPHTSAQQTEQVQNTPAMQLPAAAKLETAEKEIEGKQYRQDESSLSTESTIAIVGMSIKTAGADDIDEFSRMMQTGTSQHELVGPDRVKFHTLWREGDWDPSYKWYANWMRDIDSFDHQFFKKSSREAANMDPAQRLSLQAAYQAVESSGYYCGDESPATERYRDEADANHIGVYLGITLDDYQNHVRSHRANAFSITGNMRSLIAGKIAHHFGWTGPAMTLDTACSSSAVAIHTACRAILASDCNAALAGGVNVITDPLAFQDLAAAGFLSPSGQCKPFDDRADGYCRGEAVGFVFLKRLSDALADGNQILGCITKSAVYQNENHTPIFVPNSPSLYNLFNDVMRKSQVDPGDISVVECHGTGTPVGDPAEWESVRQALEGPQRPEPVYVGSAKGHIGHTEGASGLVALIKVLTTMQSGYIPPQASHVRLNHLIRPTDTMQIATTRQPWRAARKAALINNYGASGCNVAMVVTEYPSAQPSRVKSNLEELSNVPFCISGRTITTVKANCARLLKYLDIHAELSLVDLSFNVSRQSSRLLPYRFSFKCGSLNDLKTSLSHILSLSPGPEADAMITAYQPERQVILCFGGQISRAIGLDRTLYDRTKILQYHLNECDRAVQSLGAQSIFPDIFSHEAVKDQQHLQTMLFAMQYSCAMSWLQSGLSKRVAAVVGHSFGEITAMCISGVLSLQDTVKLVVGRAQLVRDSWGSDPGAMIAVEADEAAVQTLLSEANQVYAGSHSASIACYNGPRSFTLAGSQEVIGIVTDILSRTSPAIRNKTLRVTNAFHSSLVDLIASGLKAVGENITFQKPRIPLERTTETRSSAELLGPEYVADQMRQPVFFHHAVQRIAEGHPNCVWLEAGSSSTITVMAQRALDSSQRMSCHFQAVNIDDSDAFNNLAAATVSLWNEGLSMSFWPHNAIQTAEYATIALPPYQFERERHWVELRSPVELIEQIKESIRAESATKASDPTVDPKRKWLFTGYKDPHVHGKRQPCFDIITTSQEYRSLISSHIVAQTAGICSGMLQADLAIGALYSLHPDWVTKGISATLHDATNHAPICLDSSRVLSIEFEDQANGFWGWRIVGSSKGAPRVVHTTGRLQTRDPKDVTYQAEFRRLGRMVDHERCLAVLNARPSDDDVEILQGRGIYRAFNDIVDFGEQYRSLRWLVGRGNESAGRFSRTPQNDAWFDQLRGEHISQVGGIWVNCMSDHSRDDIFLGAEIETYMVSPDWANRPLPNRCDVLARHLKHKDTGDYTSDSFVFDPASGDLVQVLLGVRFTRTPRASFVRALQRMTPDLQTGNTELISPKILQPVSMHAPTIVAVNEAPQTVSTKAKIHETPARDLLAEMTELVANIVGVEVAEIGLDVNLVDFGVDSLLGLELQSEIKTVFSCAPDVVAILEATTIRDLVACLPISGDLPQQEAINDNQSTERFSADLSSLSQASDPYLITPSESSTSSSFVPVDLLWRASDILESFSAVKGRGDRMIFEHGLGNFESDVVPDTNQMCTALVVECFEELGCPLRSAKPGDVLSRIPFKPQHTIFVNYIYQFLEKTARLIRLDETGQLTRTETPTPTVSSKDMLPGLLEKYPDHADFTQLTYHAGIQLANALSGLTDGNRVLMSNPEGRKLCESVYHNYPLNRIGFETIRDVIVQAIKHIHIEKAPLKVLELGAGTGSLTSILLPLLASLDIPVEYTFTDLSSSLVAQARRTLGKKYSFMKFAVQDIEKPPSKEIAAQQHIIVASNAVHATRSLEDSTRNIRQALRPDGFLMMLEMREAWPALDLTFGLYEGWWLFEDGRTHVYTSPEVWKRSLTAAGYEAVDWTEGRLPEHKYYMVIIALASGV